MKEIMKEFQAKAFMDELERMIKAMIIHQSCKDYRSQEKEVKEHKDVCVALLTNFDE